MIKVKFVICLSYVLNNIFCLCFNCRFSNNFYLFSLEFLVPLIKKKNHNIKSLFNNSNKISFMFAYTSSKIKYKQK